MDGYAHGSLRTLCSTSRACPNQAASFKNLPKKLELRNGDL